MTNSRIQPPQFLTKVLRWFCREEIAEEVEGDLEELFQDDVANRGVIKAKWLYFIRTITFLKPSNMQVIYNNSGLMLISNYMLIARRNLMRNKKYTLFNIFGFSIGLLACFLLFMYVAIELSYDREYERSQDIYRAVEHVYMEDGDLHGATSAAPLGARMAAEIPEIESWATFTYFNRISFEQNGQTFTDPDGRLVSSTFLDVFEMPFIHGDRKTALKKPGSVVISESRALKYFGSSDILGETIKTELFGPMTITGVMKDPLPTNHFHLHILYFVDDERFTEEEWSDFSYYTYIRLHENSDIIEVEKKLPAFYNKYVAAGIMETFQGAGDLFLQPVTKIHLQSGLEFEIEPNGNMRYVIAMGSLAIFILIVISINYANMATAQATRRAKEVGVRKVLGSNGKMITYQFLTESLLLVVIAALIAVVALLVVLPSFNSFSGKTLSVDDLLNSDYMLLFGAVVLITAVLGASYPAIFLARFRASEVLKRNYSLGKFRFPVSRILNSIQFIVAIVMVVVTWTLYQQMNYARTMDHGFEEKNVLKVNLNNRVDLDKLEVFRQELMSIPGVSDVAIAKQAPGDVLMSDGMEFENAAGEEITVKTQFNAVDNHFFPVLKMKFLAGGPFAETSSQGWGRQVVVNRMLAKRLGYQNPEDIIDKKITILPLGDDHVAHVVGVVEDAHLMSLHHEVSPHMMIDFLPITSTILVRAETQDPCLLLGLISDKITEITNSSSHTITYLDQAYWQQYKSDEVQGMLLSIFSVLVVFLSFTGLMGLVSLNIRFKAKEISIRKIFGASFQNIFKIYIKQYSRQIILSVVLAIPLSMFFSEKLLENFAYRIQMPVGYILLTIVTICAISALVIAAQCRKTAQADPVKYLSEE